MSQGDTVITVAGNLVGPPELRFTASGAAVCNLTVASTPRHYNKDTSQWEDDETLFLRCTAWREMAENVAETFPDKGARVLVQGRLKSRSFETKEGDRRTVIELDIDEIGPSLRYATAQVRKTPKGGGNNGGGQASGPQGGFGGSGGPQGRPPQGRPPQGQQRRGPAPYGQETDPWQGQQGGNYDWGGGNEEPPSF